MHDPRDLEFPDRIPGEQDRPDDPSEKDRPEGSDEKERPEDPHKEDPVKPPHRPPLKLTIRIDRKDYPVPFGLLQDGTLTGLQLRQFPRPEIGPERDLFEVVPGGTDRKIENDERVRIQDGMRFFSAPAVINPGNADEARAEGRRATR